MILVYCEHPGPRVAYTFDVLLKRILRIQDRMELTQDPQLLAQFDGVRINYSNQFIPDCLHIPHSGFLSRSDLDPVTPGMINGMSGPCLFPMQGSQDFAYDLPAAIFWMISRYEEYHSPHTDEHGRFKSEASLAFKEGFLRMPIVEKWAVEFRGKLLGFFPGVEMKPREFRFASTIDVDNGYRFRGKGFWRTLAGFGKDLWEGRPEEVLFRFNVLMGNLNDPFDRYAWISKQCALRQLKPRFFILASPRTAFDHALSPKSNRWKELVEKIQQAFQDAIHNQDIASKLVVSFRKQWPPSARNMPSSL